MPFRNKHIKHDVDVTDKDRVGQAKMFDDIELQKLLVREQLEELDDFCSHRLPNLPVPTRWITPQTFCRPIINVTYLHAMHITTYEPDRKQIL